MNRQLASYLWSPLSRWSLVALCALPTALVVGCKPADNHAPTTARVAESTCLDSPCPGEEWPKHHPLKERVTKVNGQWFVGPAEYGVISNQAAFFWPSKTPARGAAAEKSAPEFIPSGPGRLSNFYEVGIEVFWRSRSLLPPKQGPLGLELLRQAEADGRLISKTTPRVGLEVWRIREPGFTRKEVWYVATGLKGTDGLPPVLVCTESLAPHDRCTTGFTWLPGVAVDMRFHARHGPDWPEIYQETIRVLQLLRKV
jgi:hypothetical protein